MRNLFVFVAILIIGSGGAPALAEFRAVSAQESSANMVEAKDFVARMVNAAKQPDDYSFKSQMVVHNKKKTITESANFYFKKPNLIRLEVTAGPRKGALAVLREDNKVHGHLGGLMGFLSGTVSRNSPLLKASNGYSIVDADFASIAVRLQQMLKGKLTARVTREPIAMGGSGRQAHVVEVFDTAGGEKLIKRIYVAPDSLLPFEWHEFENGKMVMKTVWKDLKVNSGLKASLFK